MSQTGWTETSAVLRHQRNRAAVVAAVSLALAFATAIPRAVKTYRTQAAANAELVALQANIAANQHETRKAQAELIRVQQEITLRISGRP
jgi:hypothetical protein